MARQVRGLHHTFQGRCGEPAQRQEGGEERIGAGHGGERRLQSQPPAEERVSRGADGPGGTVHAGRRAICSECVLEPARSDR